MPQENTLLSRLQKGDEAALAEFIRAYTPYAAAIVRSVTGGALSHDREEALLSEIFFTLWQNRQKLRPGKEKSYLAAIARSRSLNALRTAGGELSLEEDSLPITAVPSPEESIQRRELYAALRRCLAALPEPDRTIFLRHYWLCRSAPAVARELGLNLNTVQSKLRRGRERLRRELEEGGFSLD